MSNRSKRVDPWLILLVKDLSTMGSFCWGELDYANLISHMSVVLIILDSPDRKMTPISLCALQQIIEVCASFFRNK